MLYAIMTAISYIDLSLCQNAAGSTLIELDSMNASLDIATIEFGSLLPYDRVVQGFLFSLLVIVRYAKLERKCLQASIINDSQAMVFIEPYYSPW